MNRSPKSSLLIMAAGLGSRYGGNKQVDRIGPNGEILMQYSIYDAIQAGFSRVVFIIKPQHRELIEEIGEKLTKKGVEYSIVYQDFSSIPNHYSIPEERVKPFGTVHAILCAKDVINENFAVINADDFYGSSAFSVMSEALGNVEPSRCALVSYKLKNTVSPNGSVTRGICEISDGRLTKITENHGIYLLPDGSIESDGITLDPSTPVSMNMWGFSPEIFSLLERSFDLFLSNIADGDIKAEYALPTFIDEQIKLGNISVSVSSTDSEWFGVTYKEDRMLVADRLKEMQRDNLYPINLF